MSAVTQNIQQTSNSPAGPSQSQEGHQSASVSQTTDTGNNQSDLTQSLAQNANTTANRDNLTQTQNAQSAGPNSDAQVTESSTLGHNESHLNQTNTLTMQSHRLGNVTQTQGSAGGGLNGHVDQFSGGVSLAFATQNEKQTMNADPSASLTQTQFGPSFCCSSQQSNPADVFQITQSSQQFAGGSASQSNTVVGNCDTSGGCTANQQVQQNENFAGNSCSGSSCHEGVVCDPGIGCQQTGGNFTLTVENNSTNSADTVTGVAGNSTVIDCQPAPNNGGCTAQLPPGTDVALFANGNCGDWGPNSFWTGVDSQEGNSASVTMNENRNVTANYVPDFNIC